MSFRQVVHPVWTEEAEVAKLQRPWRGPDEHSQECPFDADRSRAAGATDRERADAGDRRTKRRRLSADSPEVACFAPRAWPGCKIARHVRTGFIGRPRPSRWSGSRSYGANASPGSRSRLIWACRRRPSAAQALRANPGCGSSRTGWSSSMRRGPEHQDDAPLRALSEVSERCLAKVPYGHWQTEPPSLRPPLRHDGLSAPVAH